MTESPTLRTEREPALYVALTASDTSLEIHGAVRTVDGVPGALHSPVFNPVLTSSLTAPASELVLFVLDAGGTVLDTWGWPFREAVFHDRLLRVPDLRPQQRGAVGWMTGAIRHLHVPLRSGAAFLYFVRSKIGPVPPDPATLVFRQHPIALYYFGPEPPPVPPLPDPVPTPEELRLLLKQIPLLPHLVFPPIVPVFGRLLPPVLLSGDGITARHLNVVIVGDGFKGDDELAKYASVARRVCSGLLAVEPFRSRKSAINIWSIPTESFDSGITRCPGLSSVERRTYYHVQGGFEPFPQFPGFVGTSQPEVVYGAASTALGLGFDEVHAYIVICNCEIDGGSAVPGQKLAFVTMYLWDQFDNRHTATVAAAVHECGHVIAGLADEYIGCCGHEAGAQYPNQATIDQVGPPQHIPWVGLAEPRELSGGDLTAVHRFGVVEPELDAWKDQNFLGAYWGCQDFDQGQPCDLVSCDVDSEPGGLNFFRPMWDCQMRHQMIWPDSSPLPECNSFCRVCEQALDDAIAGAVSTMTLMQIPPSLRMRTPPVFPHP